MQHIILPGLTTMSKSGWRDKVSEITKFNIKEVALFPTCLEIDERRELYDLLEKTELERIPHVHLRDDMEEWELDYFVSKFKTEVFNMHDNFQAEEFLGKTKFRDKIYIENLNHLGKNFEELVKKAAGICLDISHAEDFSYVQKIEGYAEEIFDLLNKYSVGCCHVSAVKKDFITYEHYQTREVVRLYSNHEMDKFNELDYVEKYIKYLPKYVSMELENSFEKQLKAKEYLEKIINK